MCRCTETSLKILGLFACIPYCIRSQNWLNFLEWFRKRSVYHLRIYSGVVMKTRSQVSANSKIGMIRSVVLNSYFRTTARRLKGYVGFSHKAFLGFSDSVCMRSVYSSGLDSISVIVFSIWLWIKAQIIFCAAVVGRRRVRLLYARIQIRLHVKIRICSVTRYVCLREKFWGIPSYNFRSATHFISCFFGLWCDFG